MKKVLLIIVMLLPLMAFSAVEIEGLYYDLDSYTQTAKVSRNTPGAYYGRRDIWIPSSVSYEGIEYRVAGIGAWAFDNAVQLTSITIPESVTYIEEYAFYNCSSLTSIKIPSKVHTIYDNVFYSCRQLTSIVIPKSVTSIGSGIFSECDALESIIVEEGNPRYDSRNNCNAIIWDDMLIAGCKNTIIPDNVKVIWVGAFIFCNGLTEINLPNSVIGIEGNAFQGCRNLKNITLSQNLENIQSGAFAECYSLKTITIPASVTSIKMYAFQNCPLNHVTSYIATPFEISDNVFTIGQDAVLYVPKGTKSKYENTNGWNKFTNIVEIVKHCATPTISYTNGQLKFDCETEGAVCHYTLADNDIKTGVGNVVSLTATYNISVYASKEDYENSEVATATLCWIDAEPMQEGTKEAEDGVTEVKAIPVLIQAEGNIISVQGAAEGTEISAYNTNGIKLSSTIANKEITTLNTQLPSGSTAIVKIGEKAVKVLVK